MLWRSHRRCDCPLLASKIQEQVFNQISQLFKSAPQIFYCTLGFPPYKVIYDVPRGQKFVLSVPQKSEDKCAATSAKHIVQITHTQTLREISGLVDPAAPSPLPCELRSEDTWAKPGSTGKGAVTSPLRCRSNPEETSLDLTQHLLSWPGDSKRSISPGGLWW